MLKPGEKFKFYYKGQAVSGVVSEIQKLPISDLTDTQFTVWITIDGTGQELPVLVDEALISSMSVEMLESWLSLHYPSLQNSLKPSERADSAK